MVGYGGLKSKESMKIGLVDVDGHNYPNYALMKISAWHKERGDSVEWAYPMFGEYDRVYMSKVFTFTEDNKDIWHCEVVKGGTGYDIASKLPDEVDAMQPDYSLYGIEDVAYDAHLCMKHSVGISNFLEEISRLSHSFVFLYFFALVAEEGFFISSCYSLEL